MLRELKGIKLAPSISQCDTPPCYGTGRGERVILDFVTVTIDIFLTPRPTGTPPIFPYGNTGGEVEMYSAFALAPIL